MKLMLMKQNELVKKVDTEFQLMRRLQEADQNGICECISCGRKHNYKLMDGGHFIAKSLKGNFGVRYHPDNVWPQCKQCNKWLHGNPAEYRQKLLKKIGKQKVEWLEENRNLDIKVWLRDLLVNTYVDCKKVIKSLNTPRVIGE